QIRAACADFANWWDLTHSGFPAYEGDEDELPYNPLATDELIIQHKTTADQIAEDSAHGGGLVPREDAEAEDAEDANESNPEPATARHDDEGALIPRDTFPGSTPLSELTRWAEQELELARRYGVKADKRARYIAALVKAANGDLNVTLEEAERRLHD